MPDADQVRRAVRLTYAQMMLTAVFAASTGGMFLVGFAIELGANNIWLGVMASVPQFFVVFQFVAAYFVERGVSRKWLTTSFAFLAPLGWFLVAVIPFFGGSLGTHGGLIVLIGIMALVGLAAHMVTNARGSWLGELIPATQRGRFFGYCALSAGIVGSAFAIVEGKFLDVIRSHGLFAFAGLFFFGAIFGIVSAALHIPQPDCPLPGGDTKTRFWAVARNTLRNRPFVTLAVVSGALALSGIAGPFASAYCLRDVGLSFFGLGVLNAVFTVAMLFSSPFWGRLVDKVGGRPVVILCLSLMAPCSVAWIFIPPNAPTTAYLLLPWVNLLTGLGSGGLGIAMASLRYKLSRPEGRSVQFAMLNTFMTLLGAPMPVLGGWLVSRLQGAGHAVDLRLVFYLWSGFVLAAAVLARFLKEPESMRTRTLVFAYFPNRLARLWGHVTYAPLLSAWPFRATRRAREHQDKQKPPGAACPPHRRPKTRPEV